ncbi:MAG: HAD family hydrolase [Turneriella sp.]
MKYEYFALDIDGTIFSSEHIIYPVYKESIELFCRERNSSLEAPGRERIMLEIGKPVKKIFQNLFPQLPEADRDVLSDSVLRLLCEKIAAGGGEYYPDVTETIEAIVQRGGKILVASNGRRPYIEAILTYCKIMQHVLHPTYIDGQSIFTKSDILRHYVSLGIEPRSVLMVGDRLSDLEAAQAIGCDFAWCAYGHAPPGEITSYAIRLERFAELLQYA